MSRDAHGSAFSDGRWAIPARFNFARDVVSALAVDRDRQALQFVSADGDVTRRLTFREIEASAARWTNVLRTRGIQPGDRVLVLVGKTPDWPAIMLGTLGSGAVTIPCSEMLRAKDLDFRIEHAGAHLLIADPGCRDEIDRMSADVDILYLDEANRTLANERDRTTVHDSAAGDPAFILYTSGTTKHPKGVVHTHGWTFAKRMQAEYWLDAQSDDLVWCTAGTGWAKSVWNVLLGPWSRGSEVVLHEGGFDPAERFALLERLGVNVLCQAPTEYRLMAKLDGLESHDLSALRHAVSAGEPLNPEVIQCFQDAFDLTVFDGYGQTENTLLVANRPGVAIEPGSMGHPTPGHDVAIVDDDGLEAARGDEGDVAVRGNPPTMFVGYHDDVEATRATRRGEWYITGDRARRDDAGRFWFSGRADDVILSAAYRIGPFEVESALLEHPAVAESAVVGKPDADRGYIVKAFVVLRSSVEPSDALAVELQDHVKRVTAPYKYPREIEFVPSLPKTTSGKIRRVELREREQRAAGDQASQH
jgi:acyl-coenzyme A synthetase/AMP-(fatty) acid ligase